MKESTNYDLENSLYACVRDSNSTTKLLKDLETYKQDNSHIILYNPLMLGGFKKFWKGVFALLRQLLEAVRKLTTARESSKLDNCLDARHQRGHPLFDFAASRVFKGSYKNFLKIF